MDIFTGFKHEVTIGKVWTKTFPKEEEVTMETLKMYAKKDEIVATKTTMISLNIQMLAVGIFIG